MQKCFFLDTNVLMDAPDAIYGFDDNIVMITHTVLQELDKHKSDRGEAGYNAREAIRLIERVFSDESLVLNDRAVCIGLGGELHIFEGTDNNLLPRAFSYERADNRILNDVLFFRMQSSNENTYLVTNDVSMRLNARSVGIEAQPYQNVRSQSEIKYTGRSKIVLSDSDIIKLKDDLKNKVPLEEAGLLLYENDGSPIGYENQYFVIDSDSGENQMVGQYRNDILYGIDISHLSPYGVKARNIGQSFALHALMQPVDDIPLVILEGRGGTAKTFLSLASALNAVYDCKGRSVSGEFTKVVYTRPNQLSDEDHGYLKGDLFEKMMPLLGPAFDNLEYLIANATGANPEDVKDHVMYLFDAGIIEPLSMAYMRGRSISNAYIIVDEAQNCSRGQIYDIISRAGEHTKVVLCGDIGQIDNTKLDKFNNGLSFAIDRMKFSNVCSQVSFNPDTECVRSLLAAEAIKRLSI